MKNCLNYKTPDYYNRFVCAAQNCRDTCCAGWEICIDDETLSVYEKTDGGFGEKLRNNITTDADGDKIFRLQNGRCPFLNKEKLCDIHIALGEECICEVCREHPRFTELYDGFTEKSLSVSCPTANEIIFNTPMELQTYPTPEYDGADDLLAGLIKARKSLLELIIQTETTDSFMEGLLEQTKLIANEFFEYNDAYEAFYSFSGMLITKLEEFLLKYSEILTEEWRNLLQDASEKVLTHKDYFRFSEEHKEDIKKFAAYFLYRYFLKAINDKDIEINGAFIAASVYMCTDISAKTDIPFPECVRIFSKETEHDLCNIELIKDFIADEVSIL